MWPLRLWDAQEVAIFLSLTLYVCHLGMYPTHTWKHFCQHVFIYGNTDLNVFKCVSTCVFKGMPMFASRCIMYANHLQKKLSSGIS